MSKKNIEKKIPWRSWLDEVFPLPPSLALSSPSEAALSLACVPDSSVVLALFPDGGKAEQFLISLRTLFPSLQSGYFPSLEQSLIPSGENQGVSIDPWLSGSRMEVLSHALKVKAKPSSGFSPYVIAATVLGLFTPCPSPDDATSFSIEIKEGREEGFQRIVDFLLDGGYEKTVQVTARGEMAVRGGIIDVFPCLPSFYHPIRLDFFGDQLEKIFLFSPETQRRVSVFPSATLSGIVKPSQGSSSLLDYLPKDFSMLLYDPQTCEEVLERLRLKEKNIFFPLESIPAPINRYVFNVAPMEGSVDFPSSSLPQKVVDDRMIIDLEKIVKTAAVQIFYENEGERQRLERFLGEKDLLWKEGTWHRASKGKGIRVAEGNWGETIFTERLAIFSTECLWGRKVLRRIRRTVSSRYESQKLLNRLIPGEPVVHIHHGVGRFIGLRRMEIQGLQRDLYLIEYAQGDKLLLPVDALIYLERYDSPGHSFPTLDRLGGARWEKQKKRIALSVRSFAKDLLELYATRSTIHCRPCPPDDADQRAFEASFAYIDTVDQKRTSDEIKRDMEKTTPMDRLLCGDVGFGKTEIALRAAFKMIQSGRQVALLAPTTILVQQHLQTFQNRMRPFAIVVEGLSRLKSVKETKEILEKISAGKVDLVIGTHRLLSKDVHFCDLGLVIVDEEQRFGVKQKEKLKQMRKTAHIFSMTATPIPRTLHLALVGARDISSIQTPPPGRGDVISKVMPFRESLIQEAIEREVERGGQVFMVHNRIAELPVLEKLLLRVCPWLRLAVAHGRMRPEQLARRMKDFVEGKYDVLLSTTIIENGLDLPNVNTLIVNQANHFGLAQLYQLRGRIGRSPRRAYAYFLHSLSGNPDLWQEENKERSKETTGAKRLKALMEFCKQGSGYQLALKDLEIRGAGDLIGKKQSGHLCSVGYASYRKLLERTVAELKGEAFSQDRRAVVELAVDQYIPEAYLSETSLKDEIYRRLSACGSRMKVTKLREEVMDRFGALPKALENSFVAAELRILATALGIRTLRMSGNGAKIKVWPDEKQKVLHCEKERMERFPETDCTWKEGKEGVLWTFPLLSPPLESLLSILRMD